MFICDRNKGVTLFFLKDQPHNTSYTFMGGAWGGQLARLDTESGAESGY